MNLAKVPALIEELKSLGFFPYAYGEEEEIIGSTYGEDVKYLIETEEDTRIIFADVNDSEVGHVTFTSDHESCIVDQGGREVFTEALHAAKRNISNGTAVYTKER